MVKKVLQGIQRISGKNHSSCDFHVVKGDTINSTVVQLVSSLVIGAVRPDKDRYLATLLRVYLCRKREDSTLFLSWRQTDDDLNVIVSLIDNKRDKSGSYSREDEYTVHPPLFLSRLFPLSPHFFTPLTM